MLTPKAKNIAEYCEKMNIGREDMKDYMLSLAIDLGRNCHELIDGDVVDVENGFKVLEMFNDILDNVE